MPKAIYDDVLRFLHFACGIKGGGDKPDSELLERYLAQEEAAFSMLMKRHGPMILGICRRLAADAHAAEDCFQATFMVLVRQAASIRKKESIAPWLLGVARRIVLKARAKAAAGRRREKRFMDMASADPLQELTVRELRSCLDEEIAQLPVKYQTPILLCYFEGKSQNQAAQELGCPKNTFTNRLNRGLELLRSQLNRRGITLAGAALSAALTEIAAAPPLPAILAVNTVKAATLLCTGKSVAGGCLTATALALAEEALTGMLVVKGKIIVMVLAIGLAVGGGGWAGYNGLAKTGQPAPILMAQTPAPKKPLDDSSNQAQPILTDNEVDPLPYGVIARLGPRRFRHEGDAGVAFSSDSKTLLGETDHWIIGWDAVTGKEKYRIPIQNENADRSGGLTSDGSTLAFLDVNSKDPHDFTINFWDLESGKKTRTMPAPNLEGLSNFEGFSFSPDGKSLALINSSAGKVFIVDLGSGKVRMTFGEENSKQYYKLAISPDNKTMAVAVTSPNSKAGDLPHSVELLDFATGKLIRVIKELPKLKDGHSDANQVFAITFSPNGKMLAFGGVNCIYLFDPETGKKNDLLEKKMGNTSFLAFSPDGKRLISTIGVGEEKPDAQNIFYIWDVDARKALDISRFPSIWINGEHGSGSGQLFGRIAISPDGKTMAIGSFFNTVRLIEIATGKELFKEDNLGFLSESLVYSPDGKTLAGPGYLWDTATWKKKGPPLTGSPFSFSADGKLLALDGIGIVGSGDSFRPLLRILDVSAGKDALVIPAPNGQRFLSAIFSPDARKAFTLDMDGNYQRCVRQWDLANGKQEEFWNIPKMNDHAKACLAGEGKTVRLVTDTGKGVIWILNVESGRGYFSHFPMPEETDPLPRFSPDARVLGFKPFNFPDLGVQLWEVFSAKPIYFLKGHNGMVEAHAFSRDGRFVATGDGPVKWEAAGEFMESKPTETQTVRLWDTVTGNELARYSGFKSTAVCIAFSPTSTQLAAGLQDGSIAVIDISKNVTKLLPEIKLGMNELESRWLDLFSDNAAKAHHAIGTLVAAPKQAVLYLKAKFKPVVLFDQVKIQEWIADLDNETFAVRQAAAKELEKIGDQVQPPIHKALQANPSPETRRRLEQILKALPDVPGPETIRNIRAIMALERIGSPEARSVLEALARGAPGARETEEAKASLERLISRPQIP